MSGNIERVGVYMSASEIDYTIRNAVMSMQMEGFNVDEKDITLCRQMLEEEITLDEYLMLAIGKVLG